MAKTKGYGAVATTDPKWEEKVDWWDWEPYNEFHAIRPVGPVMPVARMWVPVNPADPEGKKFPIWDPSFNSETEEYMSGYNVLRDEFSFKSQKMYLANFIIRDIQKNKPASLSPDWTPIRGAMLPQTCVIDFGQLMALNGNYDVADPEFGIDIYMKYDPKADGTKKYSNQKDNRTKLTAEELGYELYDFEMIYKTIDPAKLKADITRLGYFDPAKNPNLKQSFPGADFDKSDDDKIGDKPTTSTVNESRYSAADAPPSEPERRADASPPPPAAQASAPTPTSTPVQSSPAGSIVKPENCPTDFGQYAKKAVCFKCSVRKECVEKSK